MNLSHQAKMSLLKGFVVLSFLVVIVGVVWLCVFQSLEQSLTHWER